MFLTKIVIASPHRFRCALGASWSIAFNTVVLDHGGAKITSGISLHCARPKESLGGRSAQDLLQHKDCQRADVRTAQRAWRSVRSSRLVQQFGCRER